jgi:TetR/AcrR family transcriptional repressor of lmrAB and yxaGH operons
LKLIFFCRPKATDSKGKTLAAAAKLLRQQGYHGTALHDILAAGGSPRGSLYFHFPGGKEQIGEAALTLAGEGPCAKASQGPPRRPRAPKSFWCGSCAA